MKIHKKSSVEVVSFGCRLNAYESEIIRKHAQDVGMHNSIIVNTCAVTKEAERQAKQTIRKLRRQNKGASIIATGCAAQIHKENFSQMPEVDFVMGNEEKLQKETYKKFLSGTHTSIVSDIMRVDKSSRNMVEGFREHTRAFVQVQNGCNHRCTFCIIPFARGNARSVPIEDVIKQARLLTEKGYKEIVLTGVDISSYGGDLPGSPTLGQMVRRVLASVPTLRRLRLSSIDCVEIDEDLFRVMASEQRLMPHMHLSLQSGNTMILKRMARRHNRNDIIVLCERLRRQRSDLALGADFITGFPTETEDMFQQTLDIIKRCNITWVHAFPYSEREGTPAERIKKMIPMAARKERALRIRMLGKEMRRTFFANQIGKERTVLVERNNVGYTEHFAPVKIAENRQRGDLVKVKIVGCNDDMLTAMSL